MNAPGWYPDPEAPNLERWWDGSAWSDDECRAAPEPSEIEQFFAGYLELDPSSGSPLLARSSVLISAVSVAAGVLGALFVTTGRGSDSAVDLLTYGLTAGVLGLAFGGWGIAYAAMALRNAPAHDDRRTRSITALVVGGVGVSGSLGVTVLALIALLPVLLG